MKLSFSIRVERSAKTPKPVIPHNNGYVLEGVHRVPGDMVKAKKPAKRKRAPRGSKKIAIKKS